MKLGESTLSILSNCRVEGALLFLPPTQLERSEYVAINKALECMGGKWSRSAKAHVFPSDPSDLIDDAILTGEVTDEKKVYQFFPTPPDVVDSLLELAYIHPGHKVLEPSAGDGAIAKAIIDSHGEQVYLTLVELNPKMVSEYLDDLPCVYKCYNMDFLSYVPAHLYDRIVANPPFTKQQDIDHVNHMIDWLADGGRLVSVMSAGATFSMTKKAQAFRERIAEMGGEFKRLPEGSFKESGTMVNAVVLVVDKPGSN